MLIQITVKEPLLAAGNAMTWTVPDRMRQWRGAFMCFDMKVYRAGIIQ